VTENKAITRLSPKDIVDPTIKTIPLTAVKQLHDKEMQGYDDVINRLRIQLDEAQKLAKYAASYKAVYDQVTLTCPYDLYTFNKITIIQCGERIRQRKCKAHNSGARGMVCKERQEILRKIGAQES